MFEKRDLYVMMNDEPMRVWKHRGRYYVDEVWDVAYSWLDLHDCSVRVER